MVRRQIKLAFETGYFNGPAYEAPRQYSRRIRCSRTISTFEMHNPSDPKTTEYTMIDPFGNLNRQTTRPQQLSLGPGDDAAFALGIYGAQQDAIPSFAYLNRCIRPMPSGLPSFVGATSFPRHVDIQARHLVYPYHLRRA